MFHNKEDGNILLDYYGDLLTEHQLKILNDYFVEGLSMAEIAEINDVSKSAISDLINRSINQLNDYESKLMLIKQAKLIDSLIEKMDNDSRVDKKYIKELRKINRG